MAIIIVIISDDVISIIFTLLSTAFTHFDIESLFAK